MGESHIESLAILASMISCKLKIVIPVSCLLGPSIAEEMDKKKEKESINIVIHTLCLTPYLDYLIQCTFPIDKDEA